MIMLSKKSTLSHLVDNLDDIKRLMSTETPAILDLFENAFVETTFCKNTKHAFMTENQYQQKTIAFADNTPCVNEDMVNEKMGKKVENDKEDEEDEQENEKEKRQNQPINVQMLEVSWIYEETGDGRIRTAGDLMGIFDEAPGKFIDT